MRQKLSVLLFNATILCVSLSGTAVQAQIDIPGAEQIITKFRIQPKSEVLFATINGREKRIASAAGHAWIIEGGRKLVYTKSEGQTGPSGLGGTLNVYDPQTNQYKKLAQQEDEILSLKEARSSDGKTALLLALSFEEGCQESLVVVDPTRGEVFSEFGVKVLSVQGDTISVGYYTDTEWEKDCATPKKRMKPYKTKNYSLSALLKRRVTAPRPTKGA